MSNVQSQFSKWIQLLFSITQHTQSPGEKSHVSWTEINLTYQLKEKSEMWNDKLFPELKMGFVLYRYFGWNWEYKEAKVDEVSVDRDNNNIVYGTEWERSQPWIVSSIMV